MTTNKYPAPGLTADWLNGWLAAIGTTTIVDTRISWTTDVVPHAIVHHNEPDLCEAITAALLAFDLDQLPIARTHPDSNTNFPRKVTLDSYRDRAHLERQQHSGLLAASVSDLRSHLDPKKLDHGAFDPPAPKGTTLYERALKCRDHLDAPPEPVPELVARTLNGTAPRIQTNGLGFDPRRLATAVHANSIAGKVHVDPIIELLALSALRMFPTRGDGHTIRQRGWTDRPTQRGAFGWPTWQQPLDRWAIDAILDTTQLAPTRYHTVPYHPASTSDTTRAYASEPTTTTHPRTSRLPDR